LSNGRSTHFEDREEDFVQEYFDLFLEFLSHAAEHSTEDLAREFEDLNHGRDGVSREGEAEVLFRRSKERGSVAGSGGNDGDIRVDEEGHVIVKDCEDEVEG